MTEFIGIIPARYASTRFPGKPLAEIGGVPMVVRVCEQAGKVLDKVYVATDSQLIADKVREYGYNAVLTSDRHKTGTDRIAEAVEKIGGEADVVINIQGDEPFVDPGQIRGVMKCFDDPQTDIATLARPFKKEDGIEVVMNPNKVKVVFAPNGMALYFSRSPIPYLRGVDPENWLEKQDYFVHVGMYAYRKDILKKISALSQTPLELSESLEQLRWLENGYRIKVAKTDSPTIGIDTPEDLENARRFFEENVGK